MKRTVEINGNKFEVVQYDGTNIEEIKEFALPQKVYKCMLCDDNSHAIKLGEELHIRKGSGLIKQDENLHFVDKNMFGTLFPAPKPSAADKWRRQYYKGKYWAINNMFNPQETLEQEDGFDDELYKKAVYFTTEAAAELYRDKIVLMLQMQRWRDEHDTEVLDWTDTTDKYKIAYESTNKSHCINRSLDYYDPTAVFFSTSELACQCAAAAEPGYTKTYGERMIDIFEREKEMAK